VARLYAARGARLHLVGRIADKLARLVEELPAGLATSAIADFSKLDDAEKIVRASLDALGGIDASSPASRSDGLARTGSPRA
jgi:NADP-dependent 3-hydroxy acid dehydrogenase YdfG